MAPCVVVTPYGRPAGEALAAAVAGAKGGRPLAPVTVVVASNFVGLTARRLLASGVLGGSGVVNVSFVTPFRLAELLAADLPTDRHPVTNPVLRAAVRSVLTEDPGPFAAAAGHGATESAVVALYGELSHVSAATLDALEAAGGPASAAVGIYRAVRRRLAGFTGEDELARTAAGRPDLPRAAAVLGHVVWYLPAPLTPALSELVAALLRARPATAVVGITGAADADEAVLAACRRAGVAVPAAEVPAGGAPVATEIISVTDPDEEVRAVVRRVAGLADDGVPLDRIGVFHPVADPYVHTLEQQPAAAGIPANGPRRDRLADSAAGRVLLAALALPEARWRRDRVMALVASGPLLHDDGARRPVPASWERLSREAGVVAGLPDWHHKLAALAASIDADPDRAAVLAWERDTALALGTFVEQLAGRVEAVESASGWAAKTTEARALVSHLLGGSNQRGGWPAEELDALGRVDAALARLAALDELEPQPTAGSFRRALAAELDVSRGRHGRFGDGVVYGALSGAAGYDLDAVFVVGLTEGQCPSPRRDDPLLPDAARLRAADGELTSGAARLGDQHRAFLAALAAAPPGRRYLTFPRGDLRTGRHHRPSRWLLATATALAGGKVYSSDFAALGAPVVDVVASHRAGVTAGGSRASLLDWDLAALSACATAGGDPAAHPSAAGAERAFTCIGARRSPAFTAWDGNLAGLPVSSPAGGEVLSASRLETWAACGFRYFLGNVLGLGGRDDPERIVDLGHTDRGSALHEILERFFAEQIAAGPPPPSTPWSAEQRARLAALADEVFDRLEAGGRTGRDLHWRLERRVLAGLLADFLNEDDRYRSAHGATPVRVEHGFGVAGEPPVVVELADGRAVRFRGYADRVDATEDGHHLVTDYKTGKGDRYRFDDDPTLGGQSLQLGLYSEAAVQLLGAASAEAHYWMVNEDAKATRVGYRWGESERERFISVVGAIVAGIHRGVFAAIPGEWDSWRGTYANCRYCEFDDLCPVDRGEFAELKATAPELAIRSVLLAPDAHGDGGDGDGEGG